MNSSEKDEQNKNSNNAKESNTVDESKEAEKKAIGGRGTPWNSRHLKPIKPGEVRNPTGRPKGSISLSTRIRQMMNDDNFVFRNNKGEIILEGRPMDVIVAQAMLKASKGDMKAFDMLGKYGFGTKVDVTTKGNALPTPILAIEEKREIIDLKVEDGVLRDDSNKENQSTEQEN